MELVVPPQQRQPNLQGMGGTAIFRASRSNEEDSGLLRAVRKAQRQLAAVFRGPPCPPESHQGLGGIFKGRGRTCVWCASAL